MLKGRDLFETWAGEHDWSDWTKPTLFAHDFSQAIVAGTAEIIELENSAQSILSASGAREVRSHGSDGGRNCFVVDHKGAESIAVGVELIAQGFAPVLLFNGVPSSQNPLVDNDRALRALAALSQRVKVGADPAPAFLLDSTRKQGVPTPRRYDNRWVTFPQDFPSAGRMRTAGISRCYLLTETGRIADDLAHVLRRWQDGGIEVYLVLEGRRALVRVQKPLWFKQVFYRWVTLMDFRQNAFGGFGGVVPEPHQGGG